MNDNLIFCDGQTVYITLESKIKDWVKWFLLVTNIVVYSFLIIVFALFSGDDVSAIILPIVLFFTIIFLSLTRITLWNIYGRECMMISKSNFSFYRDFGLYKTQIQHIPLQYGLAVVNQQALVYDEEAYVIIGFYECKPDKIFHEIMTTSIKTQKSNLATIHALLDELYERPQSTYEYTFLN